MIYIANIKNNPDKDLYIISKNHMITWEIIESNIDYPREWEYVSTNLNITCEIIEKNFDKKWNRINYLNTLV